MERPPETAYLDHAATTPVRPEALAAMLPFFTETFGNASGGHALARAAKTALEAARESVAADLGARPDEIVFTAGGTEADNLAVEGAARALRARGHGDGVVVTAFEHKAVLAAAGRLAAEGFRVTEAPVTAGGLVDVDALAALVDGGTVVVSVMLVNNEVGTVQPLAEVAEVVRARAPHAVLHTDAVQAAAWVDVATLAAGAELVSVSAHKIGGPKGTGALVVRGGVPLVPLLEGGGQERGLRAGTANVAGAVGLSAALRETVATRAATVARVAALRDRLATGLHEIDGLWVNGDRDAKVAGNLHVGIPGVEAEALLVLLDRGGVCAAAGSSCSSGATEPSHVLAAMGLDRPDALASIRLSLGFASVPADVDHALEVMPRAVAQLRRGAASRAVEVTPARVLVAMSGGVDSSVAAAMLVEQGHDVTGVTLKLWGGASDSGCCSVSDVEDARRVAAQLGIPHYVFDYTDDFDARVVGPYVDAYAAGRTPNPCVECNRHIKFGRLLDRAGALGCDVLASGHHARRSRDERGRVQLERAVDAAKDQSYVLAMLTATELERVWFPVGELTKPDVRAHTARLGLRTAAKPDSQDVCFITRGGREAFLAARVPPRAGAIVDPIGVVLGAHDGIARFTIGQRRGLGVAAGERRFVVAIDAPSATVTVGRPADLLRGELLLDSCTFVHDAPASDADLLVQTRAHGAPVAGRLAGRQLVFAEAQPRVASGQLVAFYDGSRVVGSGVVAA